MQKGGVESYFPYNNFIAFNLLADKDNLINASEPTSRHTLKQLSSQSIIGQQGVNFVERIILGMKYAWRPTSGFDVGIDGEIEICDPVTGAATNTYIKVQVKSTSTNFQAENKDSLEFSCAQNDLDYWMRGNAPVILIVCRPSSNEAYWVSIKDYFRNPTKQKTKKVVFDKNRDRFTEACAPILQELSLPPDTGIFFSPLNTSEDLFTNLLKVTSFCSDIYVAETQFRNIQSVWGELKNYASDVGPEWILKDKMIVSFNPLNEFPFDQVCDPGTCERFDSAEWAESSDEIRKKEFVQLLNMCLKHKTRMCGLYYHKEHDFYYFPANRNLNTRHYRYQSIHVSATREVFKQYYAKGDPTRKTYCRHSAFKGNFLRLGNAWFLELTPTYHFTINGKVDYPYREELLQGIKRLERNPAVVGQLLMWSELLKSSTRNLFSNQEYPFLVFGALEKVSLDAGIPDEAWYGTEEGLEKHTLSEVGNQLRIF